MNLRLTTDSRLTYLLNGSCSETLTEAEQEEFDGLLATDTEAQQVFIEYCAMHAELLFEGRANGALASVVNKVQAESMIVENSRLQNAWTPIYDVVSNYITLSLLISAIVMAIVVLSMGLIVPDSRAPLLLTPDTTIVARITATRNVTWDASSVGNATNRDLFAGEQLVLKAGLVEVTFGNDAVVLLEGPAKFTVSSIEAGILSSGRLTATVPPSAIGFVVDAPFFRVVDLGTEFGVDMTSQRIARVVVYKGKIDVSVPTADGREHKARLVDSGMVEVTRGRGLKRLSKGAEEIQLVRHLSSPEGEKQVWSNGFSEELPPMVDAIDLGSKSVVSGSEISGKSGVEFLNNGELGEADYDAVLLGPESSVTFTFDTTVNTAGYDITEIVTYAGWKTSTGGRSNQGYEIELTLVDGTTATLLRSSTLHANLAPTNFWTKVRHRNPHDGPLAGVGNVIATGVKAVTWKTFDAANPTGPVVFREFDVKGKATVKTDNQHIQLQGS